MVALTEWLDIDDLAGYLKIPKSTLYKLLQRSGLPGHKIGRTWRFDREEIDTWVKSPTRKGPRNEELTNDDIRREPAAS
jgi:excisionase family DNA binding protein